MIILHIFQKILYTLYLLDYVYGELINERNFEIDDERKYISLTKDFKKLIHAVVKGRFYPSALKKLSKQGIDINSDRQTYSWIVEKAHNLRDLLRSTIIRVFAKLNLLHLIKLARKYIIKT